jgi:GR25 family glycosyltransferase involved in LPS biosynthesis
MFSAGHANTSLAIAKILEAMNCEVVLLHKQDADWWDDVHELKNEAPKRIKLEDQLRSSSEKKLDLVIETTFFLTPAERSTISNKSVWYNRKPSLFNDIEGSVYSNKGPRDLTGISAIWLADIYCQPDDIAYLETLYPGVPIDVVPWIWTPDIVEAHRKTTKSPTWTQVYEMVKKDAVQQNTNWSLHITETNASSSSSCTLPMVIVRHAHLTKKMPVSRITFHNMDVLKENKFFNENVLKHSSLPDVSFNLMGRQRIIDWVHDPKSVIISHTRFMTLKTANLEAAWVGIPVVHNNEILRSMGLGLDTLYYPNNSVTGAAKALHTLIWETEKVPYINSLDKLSELRKKIIERFYPLAQAPMWAAAVTKVINMAKPITSVATSVATSAATTAATSAQVPKPVAESMNPDSNIFKVLFTDMWDGFNEEHNMFTLALETALKTIKVEGHSIESLGTSVPSLTIFGPFGEEWRTLPLTWPKAHFTGENTEPIMNKEASVKLNIGYKLPDMSDNSYLRMPLWMFEIDWFGADLEKIRNPLPLPIDTCTTVQVSSNRPKFCAFVVTNPRNQVRNKAFTTLNKYKTVDSAGRLYNNIGSDIFAGLGGGGGELLKHTFLKNYRFCLAYENQSAPGYTTEKILHAKAAGCVPIYWGDPKVGRDFNEKGFLNANDCKSEADLIELVDKVESDPQKLAALQAVPALSSYSRDLVRRTFAEMVRRFVSIANREDLLPGLPSFLGAKTSAEADAMRAKNGIKGVSNALVDETRPVPVAVPDPKHVHVENHQVVSNSGASTLFTTAATQRFWPFLIMWLNSIKSHGQKARVYVGSDVSDSSLKMTQEKFADVEFVRFPTATPSGFSDFWAAKHYAWKLWILDTVAREEALKGHLIFYMDCASVLLRWPAEWLQDAFSNGIALLEDSTQKNKHWCHETFCELLKVTDKEKEDQQLWAGSCAFIAGHPNSTKLFADAYKLGQDPDIIVGDKWSGLGPDGHHTGHRHDQSILSILSGRLGMKRFPLNKVYGAESARTTFHSGLSIYVHRGCFVSHKPLLEGIDDAFVINLDRRQDRKENFLKAHPDMKGHVRRLAAYDGLKLSLTPSLCRLFKTNDFFWKKAVMGCALSHLKLWNMLISEPPDIQSFLIMEDDARLAPGWREAWTTAYKSLPSGWDCVYLGGILPPNRAAFANSLERVGPGLCKVAPNKIFGQKEPNTYFHFCAYAYVLSRRGAEKILGSILERDGYWTSADHMVCNRVDKMNLYVLDPLVAGASQDDDPAYQSAQFNNFSRVDNFDSDLWNNDERFSAEEIQEQMSKGSPLQIGASIVEVDQSLAVPTPMPVATPVPTPTPVAVPMPTPLPVTMPLKKGPRFVSLDQCKVTTSSLYEGKWLQDLFQQEFIVEPVSISDPLEGYEQIIVIVIKTLWDKQVQWLSTLASFGKSFQIIHLADEYGTDPIDFYSWPEVTGVLRIYTRPDLPKEKVLVIPLGYHWQFRGNRDVPHLSTPDLPFRELNWSFAGTDWMERSNKMAPLNSIQKNYIKWFENWNDPGQLKEDEYTSLLLNSKFVPCPAGQNVETYRFYEALDCGCIPLFLNEPATETWLQIFNNEVPFLKIDTWEQAAGLMHHLLNDKEQMEQYRKTLLMTWAKYKMGLKERVRQWLAKN